MTCADNLYLFRPMFQESGHDVKSLINLTVGVDEIRVVHGQYIVDTDVHIDACLGILVLDQGHFHGRHVTESSPCRHRFYNLSAVFYQLVLIVSHSIVKSNYDVNIGQICGPETVHAGTSCRNCYFTLQKVRMCLLVSIIKRIF